MMRGRYFLNHHVPEEHEVDDFYNLSENNMEKSTVKQHLISAGVTFASVFLVTISAEIANPSFGFTKEALLALSISAVIAGVRGVAKLILEWYFEKRM